MKRMLNICAVLTALVVLLASCKSPAPATVPAETQSDPQAVFTAAAQTAQAMMTQMAATTPTAPPATNTPEPSPTTAVTTPLTSTTPLTATAGLSGAGLPGAGSTPAGGAPAGTTPAAPAPTAGIGGTGATGSLGNMAEFVTDVTVPDGTAMDPGEDFTKTWRIKNAGTNTWSTEYSLVYANGTQMGSVTSVPMPTSVAPGSTVDISVNMKAPSEAGEHFSYWMLRDAAGNLFGLGPAANSPIYVQIMVGGGGAASNSNPAATSSASTSGSSNAVSNLSVEIEGRDEVNGCPNTFYVIGSFEVNEDTTVSYRWEAGASDPSFKISLPSPTTASMEADTTVPLAVTLNFEDEVTGWIRLHITQPVDIVSKSAEFTLTCD